MVRTCAEIDPMPDGLLKARLYAQLTPPRLLIQTKHVDVPRRIGSPVHRLA